MNVFELASKITLDKREFDNGLKAAEGSAQKLAGRIGKVFKGISLAAGAVGVAGAAAFAKMAKSALDAVGELEQNIGGAESVFGQWADYIKEQSVDAAYAMGLSANDYLAAANKMGSLLQGAGFSQMDSAELAAKSMQRAADVASIMGIEVTAAMDAISGAAKGNFTMMDNLGVAINDTTLKAYAASKGWKKAAIDNMNTQEKVGLALELFMEKTEQYDLNYIKENKTLAGALTTLKAEWQNFLSGSASMFGTEDVQAENLGEAIGNAADIVIKSLSDIVPRLTKGLKIVMSTVGTKLPQLMKTLLPGIEDGVSSLLDLLGDSMPYLLQTAVNLVPSIVSGLGKTFVKIGKKAPEMLKGLWDGIKSATKSLGGLIFGTDKKGEVKWPTWDDVKKVANDAWEKIKAEASKLAGLVLGSIPDVVTNARDLFNSAADAIKEIDWEQVGKNVWEKISSAFKSIKEWFKEKFTTAKDGGLEVDWAGLGNSIIELIGSAFNAIESLFKGFFTPAYEAIKEVFAPLSDWFKANVIEKINGKWDEITAKVADIVDSVKAGWTLFKLWFSNAIIKPVKDAWDAITTKVAEIVTAVENEWTKIVSWFSSNIINPISSAWNGVLSGVNSAIEAVESAWSSVVGWFDSNIIGPIRDAWNEVSSWFGGGSDSGSGGGHGFEVNGQTYPDPMGVFAPHANGLSFVPENGYLAELHFGEAVLSRNEAEKWRNGQSGGDAGAVDLSTLTSAVANAVVAGMSRAKIMLDGEPIAQNTSNRQAQDEMAWRFAVT